MNADLWALLHSLCFEANREFGDGDGDGDGDGAHVVMVHEF